MASSIAKTSSNAVQNVKKETNSSIQNKPQNRTLDAEVALQNAEKVRVSRDQKNLAPLKSNVSPEVSVEPVYYCGAQTKKGTSCTRRVKDAGRCWQHTGQPVNLPKEKLVVRNK